MGKNPKGQQRGLKGCPYKVTITCDLTPPYNFIRETRHKTLEAATRAIDKAKRELQGTPGLKIVLSEPSDTEPPTSWARILAVRSHDGD